MYAGLLYSFFGMARTHLAALVAILGGLLLAPAQAGARSDSVQGALTVQTGPTGLLNVTGWASDSSTSAPVQVQLLVNGIVVRTVTANQPRTNGPSNGFAVTIGAASQPEYVCAEAIAVGDQTATVLACQRLSFSVPIRVVGQGGTATPTEYASFFWTDSTGNVAKPLFSVPIQNGVAVYNGEPLPVHGGFWAVTVHDQTGLPILRTGPIATLPGPPSVTVLTKSISVLRATTPVTFGLNSPDGDPGLVLQQLQGSLPSVLHIFGVGLAADSAGHEIVTVHGQLKFGVLTQPFTYTLTLTISPTSPPGHPDQIVSAYWPTTGTSSGANLNPYSTALNQAIVTGVQRALDTAVTAAATNELQTANAGFPAALVSVTSIQLQPNGSNPTVTVLVHGGAITGGVPTTVAAKR